MNKSIFIGIIVFILIASVGVWFIRKQAQRPYETQQDVVQQNNAETVLSLPSDSQEEGQPVASSNDISFENDADHDGLDDAMEAELGTSDTAFDTDKDGISDQLEINVWKTDPTNSDTDGDGFSDGIEILQGYNPLGEGRVSR